MTPGSFLSPAVETPDLLPDWSSLTSDPQLTGCSREREGFFQKGAGRKPGLMYAGAGQGQAFPEQEDG